MPSKNSFGIKSVVKINGCPVVVTDITRSQATLRTGDRVAFVSPLGDEFTTFVPRLVQFSPAKNDDYFMFELPPGARSDVSGWLGMKR